MLSNLYLFRLLSKASGHLWPLYTMATQEEYETSKEDEKDEVSGAYYCTLMLFDKCRHVHIAFYLMVILSCTCMCVVSVGNTMAR